MIICPAQPFDIDQIMMIERQSFIPAIQEKRRCFEKRLKTYPEGFFVLSDTSEETVKQNGNALTCGYFCSELWDSFPEPNAEEKIFKRRFALGHNAADTHSAHGMYLYVSSFALSRPYRSKGYGAKFFKASLAALCGANKNIKTIVLLVNSEWENAVKIYQNEGFSEVRRLKDFFPTLTKKTFADGIVMTISADKYRELSLEPNADATIANEIANSFANPFAGVRI